MRFRATATPVARARVTSALTGDELLPATPFPCAEFERHVREAIGRPSRTVTLFHAGALLPEDFRVAANDSLEFTAVFGDALTEEEREPLLRRLSRPLFVLQAFRDFSEAAKDDRVVVLAAVQTEGQCLEYASKACKNDKEIVLAAVCKDGGSLCYAGEACKNDKDIVLAAVRQGGWFLRHAGETCKNDKDIVLAAVSQNGWFLQHAGEACKNDKDIVLAAVQQSSWGWQYAGPACKHDPEILQAAGPAVETACAEKRQLARPWLRGCLCLLALQ